MFVSNPEIVSNKANEDDYNRIVYGDFSSRFLPGSSVEIIGEFSLKKPPSYALFDFDGTLSLIREGWQDIMISMMVEALLETGTDETEEKIIGLVRDFVTCLTGKQTIYQMIQLAEEVRIRKAKPEEPLVYKHRYQDCLMKYIHSRREGLRSGRIQPEELLVPHSYDLLGTLRDKGVTFYLASGTDEKYVREEAELLGLHRFFGDRIYGAADDYRTYSKKLVIERILALNRIDGENLIGFGDGYVEIDNVKSVGGTAVAVASEESGRSGKPDAWKRDRLIGIGADIVIPDFSDYKILIEYLWNEIGDR